MAAAAGRTALMFPRPAVAGGGAGRIALEWVMAESAPAHEPPTDEDLDRIEETIARHGDDHVVRIGDIGPLVMRLVAEVRRLMAENRRLADRARGFDS